MHQSTASQQQADIYQSPYSQRQLREQSKQLQDCYDPPSEDKKALKDFFRIMNPKQQTPATQNDDLKHHSLRYSMSSQHSGRRNKKTAIYNDLIDVERPKRQERDHIPLTANESESKVKLEKICQKLEKEEGFSHEQVGVVNQNMIFFKSVHEVKKRQEEQKEKMKPQNFKQTQSKISAHFKERNNNGNKLYQSVRQSKASEGSAVRSQKRQPDLTQVKGVQQLPKQQDSQQYEVEYTDEWRSSDLISSPEKQTTVEIEDIIDQNNKQFGKEQIIPTEQDDASLRQSHIFSSEYRESMNPFSSADCSQSLQYSPSPDYTKKRDFEDRKNIEIFVQDQKDQDNTDQKEDSKNNTESKARLNKSNRLSSGRLSMSNYLSPIHSPTRESIGSQIIIDHQNKKHHQESTEAYLAKFRVDKSQDQSQQEANERMISPKNAMSPKVNPLNTSKAATILGMRQTLMNNKLMKPVKQSRLNSQFSPQRETINSNQLSYVVQQDNSQTDQMYTVHLENQCTDNKDNDLDNLNSEYTNPTEQDQDGLTRQITNLDDEKLLQDDLRKLHKSKSPFKHTQTTLDINDKGMMTEQGSLKKQSTISAMKYKSVLDQKREYEEQIKKSKTLSSQKEQSVSNKNDLQSDKEKTISTISEKEFELNERQRNQQENYKKILTGKIQEHQSHHCEDDHQHSRIGCLTCNIRQQNKKEQ